MKPLVLTLIGLFLALCPAAQAEQGHRFEGRCYSCHLTTPEKGTSAATTLKTQIDQVCKGCHQMQHVGHPTGVYPVRAQIPQEFPRGASGQIMCVSCHNPCAKDANNPDLLRGTMRGTMFCTSCHDNRVPEGNRHLGLAYLAHPESSGPVAGEAKQKIDEASIFCFTCHGDGMLAPKANVGFDRSGGYAIGHSHPVGVDYEDAAYWRDDLHTFETVKKDLTLIEGRTSCLTCHNLYEKRPDLLARSNSGSGLCLFCHDK